MIPVYYIVFYLTLTHLRSQVYLYILYCIIYDIYNHCPVKHIFILNFFIEDRSFVILLRFPGGSPVTMWVKSTAVGTI